MSDDTPLLHRWGWSVARGIGRLAFVLTWLWTIGATWYSGLGPAPVPQLLAGLVAIAFPVAWYRYGRRTVAISFVVFLWTVLGLWTLKAPKVAADWAPDLARTVVARTEGTVVRIEGVRDCRYRTPEDFDVHYGTATVDLRALRSVDFVVERFHAFDGLAHTLLTFGFEGGQRIAISVEIRRERGESFSPIAGMFKNFEIIYVMGTEQDLIGLRTNHRKSRVWLYPIRTTPERMRRLFVTMLERAERLAQAPEFYHSLLNTCTTNLVDHVVHLVPGRIPFSWRTIVTGYAGELAYELGLIDTSLAFDEAQRAFRIDEIAQAAPIDGSFPERIRAGRPGAP
jgi:hypothetical protein